MIHVFIVNPYAGKQNFADNLRLKLKELDDNGIEYYIFNSRYPGHETELMASVREIFDEEKLRVYCCGGSGTLCQVMSGIKDEDMKNVELASYPCGLTNDFLKVFKKEDQKRFHDINELINGEVIEVDYIKTSCGKALNTFTEGMDTNTTKLMDEHRYLQIVGDSVPYTLGLIYGIFVGKQRELIVETEFGVYDGKFMEMFFGNGNVLGGDLTFFESADVTDGKADIRMFQCPRGIPTLLPLIGLMRGKFDYLDKKSIYGKSSYIKIRSKDGQPICFNHDGELKLGSDKWEARVIKKGLKLVVPRGVRV